MNATSNSLRITRIAGVSLIAGIVLMLIASLVSAGSAMGDSMDQTDVAGAIEAVSNNPDMTQLGLLLTILGLHLEAFGLLALFRLAGRQDGFSDMALRYGLIGILFSLGLFVVHLGGLQTVVYVMQNGLGEGTGPDAQPQIDAAATAAYMVVRSMDKAFLAVSSIASILLGLGMAAQFGNWNIFKIASYGLALVGVALVATLVSFLHIDVIDKGVVLLIDNGFLMIASLTYICFGVGMVLGRSEFVAD